jgi:hypothetical protein
MVRRFRGRSCAALIGFALFVAVCLAASATAAEAPGAARLDATWRPIAFAPPAGLLDARVGMRPSTVERVTRGSWWGGPSVASTGETVTVYLSDAFPQDSSARATWVDFFAWLEHGSELSSLTVYVALLSEVKQYCGPEAGGCYSPARKVLVIPGDLDPGVNFDIAAHEYGHHIAANRRNDPWDANGYGPKRWATYVGVCSRVAAGTAFPGDEGAHYTLNAGEAFAEAYRALQEGRGAYPWARLPLVVDAIFAPDAGSESAALADVQQPWNGPTSTTWDGRFTAPTVSLNATIGQTVSLKTAGAAPVKALARGPYAVVVRDVSKRDNFHLSGPGVDRRTGVPGRGQVRWTLDLQPGTYRYRSDAHPALRGSFTVAGAGASRAFTPLDRTVTTGLDGTFQATVSGTANATLQLLDPPSGRVLGQASAGTASATVCGQRSLLLRVTARQAGTFRVLVSVP